MRSMLWEFASRWRPRRWPLLGVVPLLATAALVAGCGDDDSDSPSGDAAAGTEGKSVFVVSCAPRDPYCATYNEVLQRELEERGIEVQLATNAKDSAQELQQIGEAISQQPDLIINLPTDSFAVAQAYARARQAGIPVIATVNPVSPEALEQVTSQVYADNEAMGRIAAEHIKAGLEAQGKDEANVISITGNAASLTTTQRQEAFEEELASTPGLDLVAVEDGNWDPIQTQRIASQLFAAHEGEGGIQAAFGMSGLQATGIIRAARQAGLPVGVENDGLIVAGSNCGPVSIEAIEDGTLYGDASETPSGDAEAVLPYVEQVLSGEELEKSIATPIEPITEQNIEEWAEPCTY